MSGFSIPQASLSGLGRGRPVNPAVRLTGGNENFSGAAKGFGRGNIMKMPERAGTDTGNNLAESRDGRTVLTDDLMMFDSFTQAQPPKESEYVPPPSRVPVFRENSAFADSKMRECFSCGEFSHATRDCPKKGASGAGDEASGVLRSSDSRGNETKSSNISVAGYAGAPDLKSVIFGESKGFGGQKSEMPSNISKPSGFGDGHQNSGFAGRPRGQESTKPMGGGFGGRPSGQESAKPFAGGFGAGQDTSNSHGSGFGGGSQVQESFKPSEGGFGGGPGGEVSAKPMGSGFGGRSGGGFGDRKPEGGGFGDRKPEGGGFGESSGGFGRATDGKAAGGACRICEEEGHFARDCPKKECRKCKEKGHFAKDCPIPDKCVRCGEEGHFVKDCTKPEKCHNCGQEGHGHNDCVNERMEGLAIGDAPVTYVPVEKEGDVLFEEHINAGINFARYDEIPVQQSGYATTEVIKHFLDANLAECLMKNVHKLDYSKPTPIQKYALPIIMAGRDVMGCAQTGSGKTAAFLLPILHKLLESEPKSEAERMNIEPRALIVAPTRELATQIYYEAKKLGTGTDIKCANMYGGVAVRHQMSLARGCDVLVATPGRLLHMLNEKEVRLNKVKFFVMDEADKMMDMGFRPDMERILEAEEIPKHPARQTLMFSATFPDQIQLMAMKYLHNHAFVTVGILGGANMDIVQTVIQVSQPDKNDKILELLKEDMENMKALGDLYEKKTLVFVERKKNADFLGSFLSLNELKATTIHGDRFQAQRERALGQFKHGDCPILIATSVAGRGLDIRGVDHVINYDLPQTIEEYVHRIGRTGRIGNTGRATSFYDNASDTELAHLLLKVLSDAQQIVPSFLEEESKNAPVLPGGEKLVAKPSLSAAIKDEDEDW